VLRLSSHFVRTLRDDPADAEVDSHRLLVRAGYVRRVAPGIYTWLPLGLRVVERVATIVREEMERIGGQEVLFPALLPREHYETSGRWSDYGDLLFRLQDRRGNDYLLGPTHEELFTTLVKGECSSYKDLPLVLFQIQTKYRDEARPRAGVLRGREFVMKDSYSFDLDDDGLRASYALHRDAYQRIFGRLGLEYRIVSAVSGAMGGSSSEEFLGVAASGEDTFVSCPGCGYAANTEAVEVAVPAEQDPTAHKPLEVLDTPDTPTIATLVAHLVGRGHDVEASNTLKNVVVRLRHPDGSAELLAVGVPGDREVDMKRLAANVAPSEVEPADIDDSADVVKGYIGPQGLSANVRYVVDPLVVRGSAWVTGANVAGHHAVNVVCGRDFEPSGLVPAAEVRPGDACGRCGAGLELARGIEIGHIFQLGRKYAEALDLKVLDENGKLVTVTMGSYGIGVTRILAAIAEATADERGLLWPRGIAPFDVHVVATGKDEVAFDLGARLAAELEAERFEVLFDDRPKVSPGVKFGDAELLGVPTVVIVGRGAADGVVELWDRRTNERTEVPASELVERFRSSLA
jgi:prolyl-tRNA synthetase